MSIPMIQRALILVARSVSSCPPNSVHGVDPGGRMKLSPGLSFSWKRALSMTKGKSRLLGA